jgi:hypothetical protein
VRYNWAGMTAPPQIIVQVYAFVALNIIPLGGFAYSLKKWHGEVSKAELPMWRRAAANIGFFTVGVQIGLLLLFWVWPRISRDLIGDWARWVFPTFLVAVPLIFAVKGPSRWWLLSSSVIVFALCFFASLIP